MQPQMTAALALALTLATPARADLSDLELMQIAVELGSVLGSEEACELSIDADGVAAYLDRRVPGGDIGLAPQLNMQVMGTQSIIGGMGVTQKMTHCMAVEAAARGEGLLVE